MKILRTSNHVSRILSLSTITQIQINLIRQRLYDILNLNKTKHLTKLGDKVPDYILCMKI